jgi:nucleotide-binding universal stress UspA family protein
MFPMIRDRRFERIVVGCDGTPEGRAAIALGASIASATGATLVLVGVYPTSFFPVPGSTDRSTLRRTATAALTADRDALAPDALIDTVADLSVPRALRHYVGRWRADLLVIGSNPSAPDGHAAIGRRGRQLIGDAQCSLALARRGLVARPQLAAIGVGFDGGPESQAALGVAAQLAHATGARLLVRTVVDDHIPLLSVERALVLEDWVVMWEQSRDVALARARYAAATLGVDAAVSATVGDPGSELRALSQEVDLLVIGSRRWGPFAHLIAGAAGETLIADAGCSVLIVPRPSPARNGSVTTSGIENLIERSSR